MHVDLIKNIIIEAVIMAIVTNQRITYNNSSLFKFNNQFLSSAQVNTIAKSAPISLKCDVVCPLKMPIKFFTNLFSTGKKEKPAAQDAGPPEDHLPRSTLRRVSSSKSGKLKIKKEKNLQNITDDSVYVNPKSGTVQNGNEALQLVNSVGSDGVFDNTEEISVDEVLKEMYEVAHTQKK